MSWKISFSMAIRDNINVIDNLTFIAIVIQIYVYLLQNTDIISWIIVINDYQKNIKKLYYSDFQKLKVTVSYYSLGLMQEQLHISNIIFDFLCLPINLSNIEYIWKKQFISWNDGEVWKPNLDGEVIFFMKLII